MAGMLKYLGLDRLVAIPRIVKNLGGARATLEHLWRYVNSIETMTRLFRFILLHALLVLFRHELELIAFHNQKTITDGLKYQTCQGHQLVS